MGGWSLQGGRRASLPQAYGPPVRGRWGLVRRQGGRANHLLWLVGLHDRTEIAQGSVQDVVGLCLVLGLGRACARVVPTLLGRPFRLAAVVNPGLQVVQQLVILDICQAELEHRFLLLVGLGHCVGNHGGTHLFDGFLGFVCLVWPRPRPLRHPPVLASFVFELSLQTLELCLEVWAQQAVVGQVVEDFSLMASLSSLALSLSGLLGAVLSPFTAAA